MHSGGKGSQPASVPPAVARGKRFPRFPVGVAVKVNMDELAAVLIALW
jgi:hypothetical protein